MPFSVEGVLADVVVVVVVVVVVSCARGTVVLVCRPRPILSPPLTATNYPKKNIPAAASAVTSPSLRKCLLLMLAVLPPLPAPDPPALRPVRVEVTLHLWPVNRALACARYDGGIPFFGGKNGFLTTGFPNPKPPETGFFFFLPDSRCVSRPWDFSSGVAVGYVIS